ncbi:nitrite reductase small subunit NirD [Microbacterium enclense]|uniref:nitrite reductase small subunit NirD n=1 Tax=Microbacterium enclense TaxID=993073 RepID=UPI0027E2DB72|nr:nitrite reductase small subunit NirD [Microbacterium enclense]
MTIVDATRTDAMTPDAITLSTPSTATGSVPAAAAEAADAVAPAAAVAAPVASAPAVAPAPAQAAPAASAPAEVRPAPAGTAAPASEEAPASGWVQVCRVDDLLVERGAAALIGDRQIALFRTYDGRLYATDQIDPFSGAAIMSRGIVGDRAGAPTVASPMYKQVFDLRTGACLDTQGKDPRSLRVHPVAVDGDVVLVKLQGDPR